MNEGLRWETKNKRREEERKRSKRRRVVTYSSNRCKYTHWSLIKSHIIINQRKMQGDVF